MAESVPTFTFTRTVVRYFQNGNLIRSVVLDPFSLSKMNIESIGLPNLIQYIEALFDSGSDPKSILSSLNIPPYINIKIPAPPSDPSLRSLWRQQLANILTQITNLNYRKSLLLDFVQRTLSNLESTLEQQGYDPSSIKNAASSFLEKVKSRLAQINTMEDLEQYESEIYNTDFYSAVVSSIGKYKYAANPV